MSNTNYIRLSFLATLAIAASTIALSQISPIGGTGGGSGATTRIEYTTYKAAVCQGVSPSLGFSLPAVNPATAACATGTNTQLGTAQFADAANQSVQDSIYLPTDLTGVIDAKFRWRTVPTTGSAVWQIATACAGVGQTVDQAFGASTVVIDAAATTTLQLNDADITTLNAPGCTFGKTMFFKAYRDAAHASDNLAATAELVSLTIIYRRTL